MRRQWLAWVIMLSFCVAPALAHDAPTGWSYDSACCNGKDCQPVPDATVKVTPNGYQVTIPPGIHAQTPDGWSELVPYRISGVRNSRIRISGDDDYHVCIYPGIDHILCFYAPPGGV